MIPKYHMYNIDILGISGIDPGLHVGDFFMMSGII